jgi:hypothetical protein
VREFLARPDEFRSLDVGEAFVWSALGPPVARVRVTQAALPGVIAADSCGASVYEPAGPTRLPGRAPEPASVDATDVAGALDDAL